MDRLAAGTKWIMLISGALTCTMFRALITPEAVLRDGFGETLSGPLAEIVVRNWGALIGIVGLMLIYGAFNHAVRPLVLGVACLSKMVFIGLILTYGRQFLGHQILIAVIADTVMIVLFMGWFVSRARAGTAL
ncbi:MAG: hypothetical protein ACKV2V_26420 [Blastocatellia bacterium]